MSIPRDIRPSTAAPTPGVVLAEKSIVSATFAPTRAVLSGEGRVAVQID